MADSSDVYGTARGPLARLASPLATRARARRHATLFPRLPASARILDVGCGAIGLRALEPRRDITGTDVAARADYPGPFVQADATAGLPFEDGAFDLVYSSSVIEHIAPDLRAAFAAEIRRVGRGWFVQTPAYSFPIEPHALLPFAHWLPAPLRRRYWRYGAAGAWEDIELLRRGDLARLFPGGAVRSERVAGIAKSWVAVRPPDA